MPDPRPLLEEAPLDEEAVRLFAELGTRPVINAAGQYTLLGGSTLSPAVQAAMETANRHFVDMRGLLESSGRVIAEMLGAEAAFVTSGGAAALVLGTAAILTRDHPEYLERLPDAEGIPNQILTPKVSRQKYDRCLTFAGARLVEFGEEDSARAEDLSAAIGPETVAVHYIVWPGDPPKGLLSLETVIEVAHGRGLPVIVDAAGHTYPLDNLRRFARMGADLVVYAAKYFDAPHSTGLLVGRRDLVEVALTNSFVGFESSGYLTMGRAMKVDRQEIAATVVALREWLAMDHEERLTRYAERIELIRGELRGVAGADVYRISERETPAPVQRDGIRIDFADESRAASVETALKSGEPCVWVKREGATILVSVAFLGEDEVGVVARRLREALGSG